MKPRALIVEKLDRNGLELRHLGCAGLDNPIALIVSAVPPPPELLYGQEPRSTYLCGRCHKEIQLLDDSVETESLGQPSSN